MNLGICTPYRHSEITAAALRLADLAVSHSMSVRILGDGHIERGVHPYWDAHVRSPKANGVYQWAQGCDYLAWFTYNPTSLSQAKLLTEKRPHVLVLLPHHMPRLSADQLQDFSRVVCPSHIAYQGCVERIFGAENFKHLSRCPWDSGISPVKRKGQVEEGKTKIYIPLDSSTLDEVGPFVLRVANELLCWRTDVHVTLSCAKTWPKRVRRDIAAFLTTWQGRFRVTYRQNLVEQATALHVHDWTFLPSVRADIGMTAILSLACHVPVIAYDIEPFSSVIRNRHSGFLLPCEIGTNWLGMPIADPQLASTLTGLQSLLTEVNLTNLRLREWRIESNAKAFTKFWGNEWGLD